MRRIGLAVVLVLIVSLALAPLTVEPQQPEKAGGSAI